MLAVPDGVGELEGRRVGAVRADPEDRHLPARGVGLERRRHRDLAGERGGPRGRAGLLEHATVGPDPVRRVAGLTGVECARQRHAVLDLVRDPSAHIRPSDGTT